MVKLADLGSAKRLGSAPGARLMTEIGTPSYLPPEQVGRDMGRCEEMLGDRHAVVPAARAGLRAARGVYVVYLLDLLQVACTDNTAAR